MVSAELDRRKDVVVEFVTGDLVACYVASGLFVYKQEKKGSECKC